jgi:hypothetical protein
MPQAAQNLYCVFFPYFDPTNPTGCAQGIELRLDLLSDDSFPFTLIAPNTPWPGNNKSDTYFNRTDHTWYRWFRDAGANFTDLGGQVVQLPAWGYPVAIGLPNTTDVISQLAFNKSTIYDYGTMYGGRSPTTFDMLINLWNNSVINMTYAVIDHPNGGFAGRPLIGISFPTFSADRPFHQWQPGVLSVDFSKYFYACNPQSCTYSYVGAPTLLQLFTTIVGLIGGLSTVFYTCLRLMPIEIGIYCCCLTERYPPPKHAGRGSVAWAGEDQDDATGVYKHDGDYRFSVQSLGQASSDSVSIMGESSSRSLSGPQRSSTVRFGSTAPRTAAASTPGQIPSQTIATLASGAGTTSAAGASSTAPVAIRPTRVVINPVARLPVIGNQQPHTAHPET